jgi:hypothetical protein
MTHLSAKNICNFKNNVFLFSLILIKLFIYDLFNYTFNSSGYVASNNRMISEV